MKECSNQKVEENKPALKSNFTQEYICPGTFLNNFDSQRALLHRDSIIIMFLFVCKMLITIYMFCKGGHIMK